MITVIHTYRLPETSRTPWPKSTLPRIPRVFGYAVIAFFVVVFGILWVPFWLSLFLWDALTAGVTTKDVVALVVAEGFWALLAASFVYDLHTSCAEIRLGDDGTCEFALRRRVVRVRVAEIASVKERVYENNRVDYEIRFPGRRSLTADPMPDFEDFLTRIETMNPAIEIKRRES